MSITAEERAALVAQLAEEIERAKRHGITLDRSNFQVFDGWLTVDGMEPREWVEAVSGLHEEPGSGVLVGMYVVPRQGVTDAYRVEQIWVEGTTRILILSGYGSHRVPEDTKVLVEND